MRVNFESRGFAHLSREEAPTNNLLGAKIDEVDLLLLLDIEADPLKLEKPIKKIRLNFTLWNMKCLFRPHVIIFVFIQLFLPNKHLCAYRKAWTNNNSLLEHSRYGTNKSHN